MLTGDASWQEQCLRSKEIRNLGHPEQEQLLRALLEELDGPADPDTEQAWLDGVQRRSADVDVAPVESISAEEAFERVRSRLKQ